MHTAHAHHTLTHTVQTCTHAQTLHMLMLMHTRVQHTHAHTHTRTWPVLALMLEPYRTNFFMPRCGTSTWHAGVESKAGVSGQGVR